MVLQTSVSVFLCLGENLVESEVSSLLPEDLSLFKM